ncbi:phage tail spike protein [Clostridium perfringens]|uniref:phage tail spike protein n=1 Tax=Clostridium perfringens TaxID=1502 RepID=UPI0030D449E3
MIELRDKDKNRVAGLVDYENLCIESVLESGDKTLTFYYPKKGKYYDEIVEEGYIITKKDEFVVKARELEDDYTKFECSLNLEELEGTIFDRFESVEQTITSALNLAIVGTGWTVKDNTLKKRRTIRCTNKSSLEIVREIKKVYRVDIVFNTLKKQIEVYEHLGEDKGTYFIDSLNLIALQVQSDSRQYATRIIAEGKDGLSFSDINNGKNYVENYQYSNKVKTIYWKDERYSVKESLLEDARAKLEELSKPFRSYSASILNLAELNPRYSSILDFKLGDVINLISKKNKIKDKQRIVKIIEWPQDHTKDSVELANATLKFEDIQQENQETSDTVSNITTDNGTINGSTIDSIQVKQIENFEANVLKVTKLEVIEASINHLSVIKADIQELNVVKANIGTLEATKANITELNSVKADLQQAIIGKANITDLNAAVGKINVLESKTASIENALLGNLTAENFKANSIVAGSGIIADGAIGSAQISSLSVNKLEAGDITTSKHRIVSADGTIEIVGNQILINRNNINRVILGEYRKLDNTTDYGLLIRGKDGRTVMFDSDGVHNAGITDGAIDNNKVADNANISGNKLDINSVIREVNTHGTETIKGTKVQIEDRTLDVELSTQKNTITEHGKELSSQKASLTALDNALKFKVDSQTFTQSTTTINNNINRAKEEAINTANNNTSNIINNLDIGVENLLSDSNKIVGESSNGEFIQFADIAPIIDKYGLVKYTISFDIKSKDISKCDVVNCYCQNGSATKYSIGYNPIKVTRDFKRVHVTITPTLSNSNETKAMLAFYGNYGTGNIPIIKNVKIELGQFATTYSLSKEDLKKYSDDVAQAKADLAQANAIANADGKITEEERKRIQQAQENLNTAIARADKAKQDAINAASLDATNKANNALNNAKAYTNSEITTVNTHLNKATTEINLLKGEINLKVNQTDIDKTIKTIEDKIKSTTEKITTVESNLTQKTNSIEAGVRDLNSTTQTITTNISNLNRDLSNKINSNLSEAKSFATDIAIAKANLAKEQAIASADGKITAEEQKRIQQAQENLNTAIARADKAKQDAINTASTDATNKANNALNSAKAFVNAEITTVNNKVHNVESNLNILKDQIKSKVSQSDIEKSISEMKIGGRNLLPLTPRNYVSAHMSIWNWGFANRKISELGLKVGDKITFSIWSKFGNVQTGGRARISFYDIKNNNIKTVSNSDMINPNEEGFSFVTVEIPPNTETVWVGLQRGNPVGDGALEFDFLIKMPKLEIGTKATDWTPAPEDTNSLIADSIKVVDTKISDVSSSVTQLRDSVTTQINSINSKTHSIETNLGGKASKQEVTEVNNRVTTIKASLDGITQRVSATESKTQTLESNLNGKASKQEVNNVSSKVVSLETNLNGITNRVSNTESRINTLDGKVASAVTNQQFTEFKQSNDKFKFTVEQRSSVSNILPNGSFFGGDRGWLHNGSEFWAGAYSGYGFKGRITGAIKNRAAYNNPERYLQTHKAYKVKKNTTYTINFHYICEKNVQSMDAFVVLSNTEYGDYAQPLCILTAQGGSQSNAAEEKPFTYKFNTGNHEWVWIRFDHNGMKSGVNWDEFCWIYVSEVGIYEGDVGAVKWTPKGGEVYSANYQMDGLGFKGTFEDGTYASLGKDGLEWYNAGTGHAYHALTYVTSFDIPVGNPGKAYIKLPAEFTKRRSSLKWTVALRGYYYSTSGNFFPFHVHCTGARDYVENGLVVCEVQGLCKIQNGSNSGDVQFRPLTAMLIAIA